MRLVDTYASLHVHSEFSSAVLKFPDAINKVKDIVEWSYNNGLYGVALSDHQSVSGFVELEKAANDLPNDRPFKHIFADECYLISKEEEERRQSDDNFRIKYWHYLVIALDEIGLKQLYEISSRAWLRSYTYRGLLRRPNYYEDFEEVIGDDKGHIVVSSACLGGFLPYCILNEDMRSAKEFIDWNNQVFGKGNFFLECQPCYEDNEEQLKVNKFLWKIHEKTNVPIIVTTDAHYLRPEQQYIHTAFLKSKDGGDSRESDKFYATTYMFTPQELREMLYVSGFTDEQIDVMFQNTINITDRVQNITLKKKTRVPSLPSPPEFKIKGTYEHYYDKYPFIKRYALSNDKDEQYYYYQVEKGLNKYRESHNVDLENYLAQINTEMEQVDGLGKIFGGRMSDYFTVVQKIIDLIWTKGDSLVGIGRGSAGCYVTNFLLGITGLDPMLPELKDFFPWWRFCSVARSESIFDIDVDIQSFKKEQIIEAIKEHWGWRKVCQVVTWGKLTSKTSLERAGKGLGVPDDTIGYIKSLIPVKRGATYSLNDCLYGNPKKEREKVPEFIAEVNKYPGLLETALAFEGMKVSSGVHAGAVNILREDFTETGSYMMSSNGSIVSQFDLHDAEYCGDLKMDLLSIDALQTIRTAMGLLVKDGYMKWQGSLRDTYNYYLGYDVIEKDNKEMWNLLPTMASAFQYDSRAGKEALNKIGAQNLTELTLANGLMRLAVPSGEQPMDKYVRYRNNINEWYQDMTDYGIPQDEQELLKELLGRYCGLMISQETCMSVLMDSRVCNFTMKEADKARKAIAKKSAEALAETEERLYRKGKKCGRSKKFLDYLWLEQIEMSKSYAFAFAHSAEYSTECLQELNIYWKYPKAYWNAAVVISQSQTEDERENVSVAIDYGKISQSIYKAKANDIHVWNPSINRSDISFGVDKQSLDIMFGLGAISGINSDIVSQILSNRPYSSFRDFYSRNSYQGSLITTSKFLQLIKAGCFDEFEPNRLKVMKKYITLSTETKQSLTMANLPEALKIGAKPPKSLLAPYSFKKYVCSPEFFYGNHPNFKSKKLYWLDEKAMKYFNANLRNNLQEEVDWWVDNETEKTIIVDKALDKFYKAIFNNLKEYINTPEFIKQFNRCQYRARLNELVPNQDENHWSFEALSYYDREHELACIDKTKYMITEFDKIPKEPEFITKSYGKRSWRQYRLYRIAGTCIAKNDSHHTITLLDINNNVIQVKMDGSFYAHMKRQISIPDGKGGKTVMDKSWLTRGTCLMVSGYRQDDTTFRIKTYKSSLFQKKIQKIEYIDKETGEVELLNNRYGFGDDEE